MLQTDDRYRVGGMLLPRPFQVVRFGHLGLDMLQPTEGAEFCKRLLGFKISDVTDYANRPGWTTILQGIPDTLGYFLRLGTDHHDLTMFSSAAMHRMREARTSFNKESRVNHLALKCGSLEELVASQAFFRRHDVPIFRTGRYFPGSNWHVMVVDPEGHIVELYTDLEQVGWQGSAKPPAMYGGRADELPKLPHQPEEAEVWEARAKGIDLASGRADCETERADYCVGGMLLPRPFRITGSGPLKLFVRNMDCTEAFYREILGLSKTEEVSVRGHKCVFLRVGTEHHCLALVPIGLKQFLLPKLQTTLCSYGLKVADYKQLRDAVNFLKRQNVAFVDWPSELSPGVDYCAHLLAPEGHCFQLYYEMEQVGWDGKPRPTELRRAVRKGEWPEFLEPLPNAHVD
jgi:catechol-2,3-dioxygenase